MNDKNTICPIDNWLQRLVAEEELIKSLNRARAECKTSTQEPAKPIDEFFTHVSNLHQLRMNDKERISILTMLIRCHQYHHKVTPLLTPMPCDMKVTVEKLQNLINFHQTSSRCELMKYVKMLQYIATTEILITDTILK